MCFCVFLIVYESVLMFFSLRLWAYVCMLMGVFVFVFVGFSVCFYNPCLCVCV